MALPNFAPCVYTGREASFGSTWKTKNANIVPTLVLQKESADRQTNMLQNCHKHDLGLDALTRLASLPFTASSGLWRGETTHTLTESQEQKSGAVWGFRQQSVDVSPFCGYQETLNDAPSRPNARKTLN